MGKSKGQQRKETQTEGGPQCQIGLRNKDKVEKRPVDLVYISISGIYWYIPVYLVYLVYISIYQA